MLELAMYIITPDSDVVVRTQVTVVKCSVLIAGTIINQNHTFVLLLFTGNQSRAVNDGKSRGNKFNCFLAIT